MKGAARPESRAQEALASISRVKEEDKNKDGVAAQPRGGAAPAAGGAPTLQARVMEEVWRPRWARRHGGGNYSPGRSDYVKLAEILNRLGRKQDVADAVEQFKKVADMALRQAEKLEWEGHRLPVVEKYLSTLLAKIAEEEQRQDVNGNSFAREDN
jgi:hypothetical protein